MILFLAKGQTHHHLTVKNISTAAKDPDRSGLVFTLQTTVLVHILEQSELLHLSS